LLSEIQAAGWSVEALLAAEGTTDAEGGYSLTREQLERVSGFRTAPEVLAVVRKPMTLEPARWKPGTLALILDGLQDPGNVGTLIRTAAWFGFEAVFHTGDTADPYGPKAVQASMGALFRVKTAVIDSHWFDSLPPETPVLGSFLEGEPVLGAKLPTAGLLILGNEGHGISAAMQTHITRRLTIPRFGQTTESLNVASAAAILMAEFRRGGC